MTIRRSFPTLLSTDLEAARDHDIVPTAARRPPTGVMLTFEVDDVDELTRRASERGFEVLERPRDLFYGQRRAMLVDPDGALVDVSTPCDPDPEWMRRVHERDGGGYMETDP